MSAERGMAERLEGWFMVQARAGGGARWLTVREGLDRTAEELLSGEDGGWRTVGLVPDVPAAEAGVREWKRAWRQMRGEG